MKRSRLINICLLTIMLVVQLINGMLGVMLEIIVYPILFVLGIIQIFIILGSHKAKYNILIMLGDTFVFLCEMIVLNNLNLTARMSSGFNMSNMPIVANPKLLLTANVLSIVSIIMALILSVALFMMTYRLHKEDLVENRKFSKSQCIIKGHLFITIISITLFLLNNIKNQIVKSNEMSITSELYSIPFFLILLTISLVNFGLSISLLRREKNMFNMFGLFANGFVVLLWGYILIHYNFGFGFIYMHTNINFIAVQSIRKVSSVISLAVAIFYMSENVREKKLND